MTQTQTPALAYILSAGRGQRLGGVCKGRVIFDGLPLVVRQIGVMVQAGLSQISVVIGYEGDLVTKAVLSHRATCAQPRIFDSVTFLNSVNASQTSADAPDIQISARCALSDARARLLADPQLYGLLISLVDLPLLSCEDISALIAFARAPGAAAVIPTSPAGQPGHPIWLSRETILSLRPDQSELSLKAILHAETGSDGVSVRRLHTNSLGYFQDLDTPRDIQTLCREHHSKIHIPTLD